jgi:capsular polysaccharide biosynthesis protein
MVVVVATVGTYFVSALFPPVYSSSARLYVGDPQASSDYSALQSGQVLAKTYVELAQSPTVATRVAKALASRQTADRLLDKSEFEPVEDTPLIVITSEGRTSREAALLANTYATVFSDFINRDLVDARKVRVRVADLPPASATPVRPRPALYAAVALVLAAFLAGALAVASGRSSLAGRHRDGDAADDRLPLDPELQEMAPDPISGRGTDGERTGVSLGVPR